MLIETTTFIYLPMAKIDRFRFDGTRILAEQGTTHYNLARMDDDAAAREFLRWLMEREYVGDKLITQKRIREFLEHYHTKMI